MPHFRLETNLPASKIPADLPAKVCNVVATSLGKPLNYCVTTIIPDVNMSWGGTKEPAAQASLLSIGALGTVENKKHSKVLFELLTKELGIPGNRLYISFINAASSDIGYEGRTFHDIFGG